MLKDAGPVHEIKAVVKLRASAERVFEALYDFEKRVHWDKVFRVLWQVERYSESQDLIYSVTR